MIYSYLNLAHESSAMPYSFSSPQVHRQTIGVGASDHSASDFRAIPQGTENRGGYWSGDRGNALLTPEQVAERLCVNRHPTSDAAILRANQGTSRFGGGSSCMEVWGIASATTHASPEPLRVILSRVCDGVDGFGTRLFPGQWQHRRHATPEGWGCPRYRYPGSLPAGPARS